MKNSGKAFREIFLEKSFKRRGIALFWLTKQCFPDFGSDPALFTL
jgi:hypothetical protein